MKQRLLPWILPVSLIVLWQLFSSLGWLSDRILPAPWSVARAGLQLASTGELVKHLAISFQRAVTGFVIGGGIGVTLGVMTASFRWVEALLDSSIQMLRTIPHLALVPLVILWFGVDEAAKIFLVALGVSFPIYLNTFHGVRSIDPGLIEMARVYGLDRWSLFRYVYLPGALPSILVGVRFSLGVMWLTLIVSETIAATSGIGYMAMNAREFMRTDVVVLSILLYAALGKLADWVVRYLERALLPWRAMLHT